MQDAATVTMEIQVSHS